MYREIKFRAWDKKEMKMKINLRLSDLWIYYEDVGLNNIFNNDDIIFLQYTWLKDKNWKEIYEGDIVLYNWEYPQEKPIIINEIYDVIREELDEKCLIIWNIYENPDLLTK
jgi:hypothetical protein